MRAFVIYTVDGVTNGMVYAAIALALVMIWRATRVINYAQGAMAMFTTFIAFFVISHGVPFWLGFGIALVAGLALGAATERVLVRPVESRPPLNAVILTLGRRGAFLADVDGQQLVPGFKVKSVDSTAAISTSVINCGS